MFRAFLLSACASAFDSRDIPASEWVCGSAASLSVSFNDGTAARGCSTPEVLRPATVAMPTISFYDSSRPASTYYTLIIVDRDAPNATIPSRSPLRHMAVASLSQAQLRSGVSWSTLAPGSNGSSVALFNYSGPNPPVGSGCHRYYVMLYEQASVAPPDIPQNESASRYSWDFPEWAASHVLTKVSSQTTYWRTQYYDTYAGPCDGAPPSSLSASLTAGAAAGIVVAVVAVVGAGAVYAVKAYRKRAASDMHYTTMNPVK